MRYYNIVITQSNGVQFAQFTSYINGSTDFGALQVELDIPGSVLGAPTGAASIKIRGVSITQVGQASDFNGMNIQVSAGMKAGLPLANPKQAGLILSGQILQAFGNWAGPNQWIEFYVIPGITGSNQLNLTFNWKQGQTFATALASSFQTALPSVKSTINVANLVATQDYTHVAMGSSQTAQLSEMARYLKDLTASIGNGGQAPMRSTDYQGVDLYFNNNGINANDGSTPSSSVTAISYQDLIGQPTWLNPSTIQAIVTMRADLALFQQVSLPVTQVNTQGSPDFYRIYNVSVFQGNFLINEIRHLGDFRSPDAMGWITTLSLIPTSTPTVN